MLTDDKVWSLPLQEWPEADCLAWAAVCRPSHRLTRGGAAGHLNANTREDYASRYGYFLDHLAREGQLVSGVAPAGLVTPEAIASFVAELQGRVRSVTTARTIFKICRVAELIAPARDFAWLKEIARDLELVAVPLDKSSRVLATPRLVEAALSLVEQAEISKTLSSDEAALMARNGLMVAMLALCPIRLGNFAELAVGDTFRKHRDTWWIVLRNTKSRRPDERPLPAFLTPAIKRYLTVHRRRLLKRVHLASEAKPEPEQSAERTCLTSVTNAMWVSQHGRALSRKGIARIIGRTTQSTLGVDISPHLFRSCAATTAALHCTRLPHLGSALLQHIDPFTTESSYNRANSLAAGSLLAGIVSELR